MMSRYSGERRRGALPVFQLALNGRDAGADRGERIVDLVHDPRRELAHRRELLRLHDPPLHRPRIGDVLADGDHVGYGIAAQPHRDLAEPEVADLVAQHDLLFALLDLSGPEDPIELVAELVGRLPGEHLEDRAADHGVPPQPLGARLPLAVPDLNAVLAVHDVEPDRQTVDDETGEAAVLLDLARLGDHLARQVLRELQRRDVGGEDVPNDGEGLPLPDSDLEPRHQQADLRTAEVQRQSDVVRLTRHAVERRHPLRRRRGRRADRAEAAGPRGPHPEPHPLRTQTLSQRVGHRHQRGFGLLSPRPAAWRSSR